MLSVKFKGFPRVKAIVFEEPIHRALSGNGVMGAVECMICGAKAGLYGNPGKTGDGKVSTEIEEFAKNHICKPNIQN